MSFPNPALLKPIVASSYRLSTLWVQGGLPNSILQAVHAQLAASPFPFGIMQGVPMIKIPQHMWDDRSLVSALRVLQTAVHQLQYAILRSRQFRFAKNGMYAQMKERTDRISELVSDALDERSIHHAATMKRLLCDAVGDSGHVYGIASVWVHTSNKCSERAWHDEMHTRCSTAIKALDRAEKYLLEAINRLPDEDELDAYTMHAEGKYAGKLWRH